MCFGRWVRGFEAGRGLPPKTPSTFRGHSGATIHCRLAYAPYLKYRKREVNNDRGCNYSSGKLPTFRFTVLCSFRFLPARPVCEGMCVLLPAGIVRNSIENLCGAVCSWFRGKVQGVPFQVTRRNSNASERYFPAAQFADLDALPSSLFAF